MNLTLFLTITLAVLGFAGSLAAFGGEAWRQNDLPLLRRVTRRGWVALTCLVLAFAIGIVKEVRSARITNESERKSTDQQARLNAQLTQIEALQKRLHESAEAQKTMTRRFAELQLAGVVDETILLASYTSGSNPGEWPGGQAGYVSSVQKSIERVEYAFENMQRSPVLVGLLSKRFVDVAPWAISGLKKHSDNAIRARNHLNYYACGLLGSTGEMLISMDKPEIFETCAGGNIRGADCRKVLTSELATRTKRGGRYSDVCPLEDRRLAVTGASGG